MNTKFLGIGAVVLIALFIFSGINTIPRLDEKVKASWSEVENQYQRRADLIPNLVKTVKGYDMINDPAAFAKYEAAQGQLSQALGRLMMVTENYPNLKADQQFLVLQSQLEGTENRITVARRDYIGTVQEYNTTVRTFPGLIWAKIYGAKERPTFTATTEGADKAPDVQF